ncbi:MAG: PspC domain-containing protein [Thermoleophilia bacterium]
MPDDSHQDPSPGDGEESVRRLTRSADDRVIAGVCGGLARYFKIDPLITRIAAVGLVFVGGVGIVLYLAAWLLVPDEAGSTPGQGGLANRSRFATIVGAALAVIAVLIVVDRAFWFPDHILGPILIVGLVGAAVRRVIRGGVCRASARRGRGSRWSSRWHSFRWSPSAPASPWSASVVDSPPPVFCWWSASASSPRRSGVVLAG